jgi:hypothetical protein
MTIPEVVNIFQNENDYDNLKFKFPKDVETIQTAEIQRIESEGLYEAFKETRKL